MPEGLLGDEFVRLEGGGQVGEVGRSFNSTLDLRQRLCVRTVSIYTCTQKVRRGGAGVQGSCIQRFNPFI